MSIDLQTNHKIVRFLEESKAQSEIVLDDLPGILAIVDIDGLIYRGNHKLAEHLKIDFEHLAGKRFDEIVSQVEKPKFFEYMMRSTDFLKTGVNFQMDILHPQGKSLAHSFNVKAIANSDYKSTDVNLFVVTGHDVSEIKSITETVTRMEYELQTAKAVQDSLLPAPTEFSTSKISLAGNYVSASECGGDWWFYNVIGNRVFLWIGDVTGHGVSAALVTSAARATVSVIDRNLNMTPSLALEILNKAVYDASKGQKNMSFLVVAIDLKDGACTYASAGHEHPFLIRQVVRDGEASTYSIESLPRAGASPLLGQHEAALFNEEFTYLKPGDQLFLFTDGITELFDENNEQWEEKRVRRALLKCAKETKSSVSFINKFNEQLHAFKKNAELRDDMTYFIFNFINFDSGLPKFKSHQAIVGSIT